jgi:hypothetical protein
MAKNLKLAASIIGKYGSQQAFADDRKITDSFVSKVLYGRKRLSEEKKREWAAALNCKPEDIFPERQ